MNIALIDFQVIRPRHETSQEKILEWIAKAHVRAEGASCGQFHEELKDKLFKIGLGMDKIQKRGCQIDDTSHEEWDAMEIYNTPSRGLKERSSLFERETTEIFKQFYPEGGPIPAHLIHVTCTGYVAPSPAQKLVSLRNAGESCIVTHAYHMGCYASMPALRMASGFLNTSEQVDIVHTEMSSLHMNPYLHQTEQLVIQTLFADGFIKYTAVSDGQAAKLPFFKILALHEVILPSSQESMTWKCEDWGFRMTISKEVPVLIARALENFLKALIEKANLSFEKVKSEAIFAIHPGGPKIIQQVKQILSLSSSQINHSQEVLQNCGNMSSATLPHIWEKILKDPEVPEGSWVISLAFGPGLSISGSIFQRRISC